MSCERCGRKVQKSSPDPDFCKSCLAYLGSPEFLASIRDRARGAGMLVRDNDEHAKMYAFLSVFHPKMTHAQKRAMLPEKRYA
jgi:hypothetical protein